MSKELNVSSVFHEIALAKVILYEKENGSIEILYKNTPLLFTTYNSQEKQGDVIDSKQLNEAIDNLQKRKKLKHKPPLNHPWKRGARQGLFTRLSSLSTA